MPMSPDDRQAFSLKIVSADQEVANYTRAKEQLSAEIVKTFKLDTANKNLFDSNNAAVNKYQLEYTNLDGLTRSTFSETNIQDSARMKIGNYFYPNNIQIDVPSLSGSNNIWTKPKPFALTYAIGKNYIEERPVTQKEGDIISQILGYITTANTHLDIETTTGLHLSVGGVCSLTEYTTQSSCNSNGGTWTAGVNTLVTFTSVVTLKNNMVTAVNALKTFLQTELTHITTNDKNTTNQTQNNAAINNINNVIIPALNTWLAYVDFNSTGVNAGNFLSFNANTLAPTKLHSAQLTVLQTVLNNRTSFISTRISQLNTILGSITQDLSTGEITASSGLYGQRYGFLLLRLDILNGSLNRLIGLQNGSSAQDSIINSIKTNKATYLSVLPTSSLAAPGNDTATVQLVDASFLSPGDTVYVMAETQVELQRAVKSVNGKVVVLNDIVPAKYKTTDKLRLYKDLT